MPGDNSTPPIHFILMGQAKEHILFVAEHYGVRKMVIFTSKELRDENLPFINELGTRNIEVAEVVELDPFSRDALESMTAQILEKYNHYSNCGYSQIITALTGGTNLMAVSMALVALMKGLKCHYILKNEKHEVLELDFLKQLNDLKDLPSMEAWILGGDSSVL